MKNKEQDDPLLILFIGIIGELFVIAFKAFLLLLVLLIIIFITK